MGDLSSRLRLIGRPEHAILSTSAALQRPAPSHDVNGYYRALGVPRDASRKDLAAAYRAHNGEEDPHLTYIFRQLLNPRTRARYDATPPGQRFYDQHLHTEILRAASQRAARENAAYGTAKSAHDILSDHGIHPPKGEGEFLAPRVPGGFDGTRTEDRQPPLHPSQAWPYAYLLLDSTCDDVARLAQWQHDVGRALAERGCHRFAVGYHGIPDRPFLVATDLGIPVVFLHESTPVTREIVAAAATAAT